ncbi:hypothetical protein Aperf_G00000027388 [Anoplocephala perfoliata]
MSGNNGQRRRAPQVDEQELATKTLQILNRRFYLDVKQNDRGRFIKITEVAVNGHKSRILMSVPAAQEFKEKLDEIIIALDALADHNPQALHPDLLIKSANIVKDNRRYYLDLRENERGRFLRISMLTMGVRVAIVVPATGITSVRDGVAELIKSHCSDADLHTTSELPEAKVMFAGNKTFYFDVGTNRYGVFLRISELRANYRTAVTIPEHHWARFRDILNEVAASRPDVSNSQVASDGKSDEAGTSEPVTNMNGDSGEGVNETGDKTKAASQTSSSAPVPSESTAIPVA